jgi:hypothetical protein
MQATLTYCAGKHMGGYQALRPVKRHPITQA